MARQFIVFALVLIAVVGLALAEDLSPSSAPNAPTKAPTAGSVGSPAEAPSLADAKELQSPPAIDLGEPMAETPAALELGEDEEPLNPLDSAAPGALKISGVVAVAAVAGFLSL